jgi:beta-barrel assembly-enhancing protease
VNQVATLRRTVVALAVVGGCASLSAQFLISVSEEVELGRRFQREVAAKTARVTDPQVVSYVRTIGLALARHARGPKYPYSVSIADYREINAFALPGGPVWVHRGVLSAARNEAQVAGVLAHEIAHVAQRHAADQVTKNLVTNGLLGLLGAVLGNQRSAQTAQTAAQVLANGYMLKFSRDDEREADRVGAQLMRRAGWDAREMIAFMELLRHEQGRDPSAVEIFVSSHPGPAERATLLRAELGAVRGGRTHSARFRDMQRRLRRMPPAPSLGRQPR